MNQEWECAWDSWKRGQFMQMDTESMGHQAQGMLKKVVKLGREVKVRTCISPLLYILPHLNVIISM